MLISNSPHTLFSPEKAEEIAKELTKNDSEGWTYKVNHDPSGKGYSFIEIYDEDGIFVANLNW